MTLLFSLLQSCEICQEPFETYWVEEEEDWFLKNAIRVDDKVSRHRTWPTKHRDQMSREVLPGVPPPPRIERPAAHLLNSALSL